MGVKPLAGLIIQITAHRTDGTAVWIMYDATDHSVCFSDRVSCAARIQRYTGNGSRCIQRMRGRIQHWRGKGGFGDCCIPTDTAVEIPPIVTIAKYQGIAINSRDKNRMAAIANDVPRLYRIEIIRLGPRSIKRAISIICQFLCKSPALYSTCKTITAARTVGRTIPWVVMVMITGRPCIAVGIVRAATMIPISPVGKLFL